MNEIFQTNDLVKGKGICPLSNTRYERWSGADADLSVSSHKPISGRLLLLSASPAVTLPPKSITPFGQYQIILLGDRGTRVRFDIVKNNVLYTEKTCL